MSNTFIAFLQDLDSLKDWFTVCSRQWLSGKVQTCKLWSVKELAATTSSHVHSNAIERKSVGWETYFCSCFSNSAFYWNVENTVWAPAEPSVGVDYLPTYFMEKLFFFFVFVFEKTIIYKIHSLYSILLLPFTTFSCYYYFYNIITTRDEADWQIRILHWTCIRLFTTWFVCYCLLGCNKKELESAAQQDIVIEIID